MHTHSVCFFGGIVRLLSQTISHKTCWLPIWTSEHRALSYFQFLLGKANTYLRCLITSCKRTRSRNVAALSMYHVVCWWWTANKTRKQKTLVFSSACMGEEQHWHNFSTHSCRKKRKPTLDYDMCRRKYNTHLKRGGEEKKLDSTPHCSRVVPHPSTERAQTALTSVFGWEPVDYGRYGRIRQIDLALISYLSDLTNYFTWSVK